MCGIAGFLSRSFNNSSHSALFTMTDAISHRGPDDAGHWFDPDAGIALGQRRLAIIDLSPTGHQPMTSASGRYVIVYNGEIYNYKDLKRELDELTPEVCWRGHSDTEVLLAAIEQWGIRSTLEKLNGMFAFAVWDRSRRVLTLARDRLGEKPLYYGQVGGHFLFGSELKALTAHASFTKEINRDALTLYLRHNYIPAPHTIWKGVFKLPAAHLLEVPGDGRDMGLATPYWDFTRIAQSGVDNPLPESEDLTDSLEAILRDAVAKRMVADVPLGAFLSGGIDSSLIVALMQAQSTKPIRTFTIGFEDQGYNEAVHAKAVARHLGTDHTEMYVSPTDALNVIPSIPQIWDEPFSDSSQVPTYLVSRLASQCVTVSLSGDAGDELFAGYTRYFLAERIWKSVSKAPYLLRSVLARTLMNNSVAEIAGRLGAIVPGMKTLKLNDRLSKAGHIMVEKTPEGYYKRLISHFTNPSELVINSREPSTILSEPSLFADFRQQMMYLDTLTYLPDDILVKTDRAAMAVGLEGRVPFLDHRVVEFAWRLPMSAKVRNGGGKHILKEVLYRHVPKSLVDRPKMGFGVPIGAWLRGPLREWAETLLSEDRLRQQGFFDPRIVREMWQENLSGKRLWHYHIWDILMFQAWEERHNRAETSTPPSQVSNPIHA